MQLSLKALALRKGCTWFMQGTLAPLLCWIGWAEHRTAKRAKMCGDRSGGRGWTGGRGDSPLSYQGLRMRGNKPKMPWIEVYPHLVTVGVWLMIPIGTAAIVIAKRWSYMMTSQFTRASLSDGNSSCKSHHKSRLPAPARAGVQSSKCYISWKANTALHHKHFTPSAKW